ncbi:MULTISPECIES: isocitrate lyase/phosphoenolpyruvate mutase family protein [unclassified Micromonospora]|uniref:isocitrate lyase/PEP mutase family protein n=1 Tax=unclassified Micromonospora TaxID=2617518 RepID=UPI00188DD0CE|nr:MULTISPECIES: isocitrate lyase/phosphoenolpyruvate mutase family protein [unclassified Micromonospora]MBF5029114.1 isocitrate lyase/phosphoenolpyruvate mutase family protein [Micromonospora sp. ANENR4]MCZ7475756.1 isocitrate lyase/phosphoenolpyruvate mutase family protein [Micromonospora sp. WMMC273]WBC00624.1 isocitrate lyase/phosphoenolpyruvate mutase family protein [Micromonospora sp. WMMA1976]
MTDRYRAFRDLHRPGEPLLLPNAWDHASAAALAARGHQAIGTTSLGVAAAAGQPDAVRATRAQTLDLAYRLRGLPTLLTVDIEDGFHDDPAEVAGFVGELAALGVVGVNLEDGRPDGRLAPAEHVAAVIAAVRAAVPRMVVNARTDAWWLGVPAPLDEARRRAAAFRAAGADCLFVPGAPDDLVGLLAAEAGLPLNVLYRPGGPDLAALGRLGVARVSTGSLLFRAALGAALHLTDAIGAGRDAGLPAPPGYEEVQALVSPSAT